jgi:hypothetical protein
MTAQPPPSLDDLALYPRMTGWFQPTLLARMLRRVLISETFGQYADRRLLVAALDTQPAEEHVRRAKMLIEGEGPGRITPDADGAVWIDYLADLGDGFDSTYAIASLLAQETLTVDGVETRRGQVLLMGGDEVYPDASLENYQKKLLDPYGWAFQDPDPTSPQGPSLYAIPGNHDWYDGLMAFLAIFTRDGGVHVGGWRTRQRRSYFAVQVAPKWWVWGLDAQLADRVDQPQADYFAAIARAMEPGANLILLAPEPGWLYAEKRAGRPLGVIDDVAAIAIRWCAGARIPLVLSGDQHHYSRFVADWGGAQFVTSGGGGAYLHPTHTLPERVAFVAEGAPTWLDARVQGLTIGRDGDGGQPSPGDAPDAASVNASGDASPQPPPPGAEAVYPSRAESRRLLNLALLFPWLNPGFGALIGVVYAVMGALADLAWPDALYLVPTCFFAIFFPYARRREGSTPLVIVAALLNAALHAGAVFALAYALSAALAAAPDALHGPRATFLVTSAGFVLFGGAIGAALVGFAFYALTRWLGMDPEDAFSGIRLDSHRHFLRLRIEGANATLFAIGLDATPRRRDWRFNTAGRGAPAPVYAPLKPLAPRLIERPVPVRALRLPPSPPLDADAGTAYATPGAGLLAGKTALVPVAPEKS